MILTFLRINSNSRSITFQRCSCKLPLPVPELQTIPGFELGAIMDRGKNRNSSFSNHSKILDGVGCKKWNIGGFLVDKYIQMAAKWEYKYSQVEWLPLYRNRKVFIEILVYLDLYLLIRIIPMISYHSDTFTILIDLKVTTLL